MTKNSGRDLQHVMIEMVLTMLHFSIILKIVFMRTVDRVGLDKRLKRKYFFSSLVLI